jgi:hypothetical protein
MHVIGATPIFGSHLVDKVDLSQSIICKVFEFETFNTYLTYVQVIVTQKPCDLLQMNTPPF